MNDMEEHIGITAAAEHAPGDIDLLPSLSRAGAVAFLTSPDIMADFFRTRVPWILPGGATLKECRARVLRNRLGSRQVVFYRLFFSEKEGLETRPMKLIIKRYTDTVEGRKTYLIMKMLWDTGFDRQSKLKIAEPFCYLEDLGLLVLEKAHGMQLRNNLYKSGPGALARMKTVARWLAKLHQLSADFDGITVHGDDASSIMDFVRQTGTRQPRLLRKMEEAASVMIKKLDAFRDAPVTFVHGDFQCENIFVDKDRVTVVDFDRFCRSDPARDLGYMIAQMRAMAYWLSVPHGSVYAELKTFWQEYLEAFSDDERAYLSTRTAVFAARKCLQNIFYMSFVLPEEGAKIMSILAEEAERFSKADRVEEVLDLPISPSYVAVPSMCVETSSIWHMFGGLSETMSRMAAAHPLKTERLSTMLERLSQADTSGVNRTADSGKASFYRAVHVLVTMCRHMETLREDTTEWTEVVNYYSREFDEALSGAQPQTPAPQKEFLSRVSEITGPEFIRRVVYPLAFGKAPAEADQPSFETLPAQEDRGTGRATVRYRFGDGELFFGKIYPSMEPHSFEVMRELRAAGFGSGPYQVSEPVAFFPEHNFLLTRNVGGVPLMDFIGDQGAEPEKHVRRAARWLVQLHNSPVRIGPEEAFHKSMRLVHIIGRLIRAIAAMPHEAASLMDKIGRLCQKGGETRTPPTVVQTHGSFHYEHIYISEERVTAIDFDKSFPADPARDLAEFVTMLRRRTFKRTGSLDAAQGPTRAFLHEYNSHLPGNMRNLSLYWGAAILFDLFHYKKKELRDDRAKRIIGFLEKDYEEVIPGNLIRDSIG